MRDLAGKTAFITGGASGIGFALACAFARAGTNVMLADIEPAALDAAVETLRAITPNAHGVRCDVADPASVDHAASAAVEKFGKIHIVCNNAGVGGDGSIDAISLDTWRWVFDVNVMGVVHGVRAFLPHFGAHGEGGHFVNTASMAGMNSGLGFNAYSASKFAVVNISEGLAAQLKPRGIGVTVVCPGFVRTRIADSRRNRPLRYGPSLPLTPFAAELARLAAAGLDPADVAAQVLAAIRDDQLYVFTHHDATWRNELQERFDTILAAMDRAAATASSSPDPTPPPSPR